MKRLLFFLTLSLLGFSKGEVKIDSMNVVSDSLYLYYHYQELPYVLKAPVGSGDSISWDTLGAYLDTNTILTDISDVSIGATDGQVPKWSTATSTWEPKNDSVGGGSSDSSWKKIEFDIADTKDSTAFSFLDPINIEADGHIMMVGGDTFLRVIDTNYAMMMGTNAGENLKYGAFFGYQAGKDASGIRLTGVGYKAARAHTGDYCSGVGFLALDSHTGTGCSAFGCEALYSSTSNNSNAFGFFAVWNSTGNNNNGFGYQALRQISGNDVNGFGYQAGYSNSGNYVNAFGGSAAHDNIASDVNAFGYYALNDNEGAKANAFGSYAGWKNTGAYVNAFGYYALFNNANSYVTGIGSYALETNTGTHVTSIGSYALQTNTGDYASSIGDYSLQYNTGDNVSAFGNYSLWYNSGNKAIALGDSALLQNTVDGATAIGFKSLAYNTAEDVTAIGNESFNDFNLDAGNAKNIDALINVSPKDKAYVIAHDFGSVGNFANLKFSTTGTPPANFDTSMVYLWKIIHADSLVLYTDNFTTLGSGTHTLSPNYKYNRSTALGYNAEPDDTSQVMIGATNLKETKIYGQICLPGISTTITIDSLYYTGTTPDSLIIRTTDGTEFGIEER